MQKFPMPHEEIAQRRAQARRSAWLLGGLALLIMVGSMIYNMGLF